MQTDTYIDVLFHIEKIWTVKIVKKKFEKRFWNCLLIRNKSEDNCEASIV